MAGKNMWQKFMEQFENDLRGTMKDALGIQRGGQLYKILDEIEKTNQSPDSGDCKKE